MWGWGRLSVYLVQLLSATKLPGSFKDLAWGSLRRRAWGLGFTVIHSTLESEHYKGKKLPQVESEMENDRSHSL